jgi:DNA-binding beta-propeller fold protein YncE
VTNVLNGTVAAGGNTVNGGTVLRLVITAVGRPRLLNVTKIGSGFPERLDPAALVIGPTGDGLAANGTLYVADTLNNRIAAIPNAVLRLSDDGAGKTVSAGGALNGELGLAVAPGGDILTVNSGDGNLVETTPGGAQVVVKNIDKGGAGAGDLFGLAVKPGADAVYFVNDGTNTLNLLH